MRVDLLDKKKHDYISKKSVRRIYISTSNIYFILKYDNGKEKKYLYKDYDLDFIKKE